MLTFEGKGNVEHDDRELTGAARSAHVLHITPRIGGESVRVVQSALSRVTAAEDPAIALLVVVGERQSAYELSAVTHEPGANATLTPLTVNARAKRLLQRNPLAVIGTPSDLLALVRTTALKLEAVRHVVLMWPDTMLADGAQIAELETLVSETPRDSDRTLLVEQVTPALEELIERMALKPRRLTHDTAVQSAALAVTYVVVAAEQRAAALQQLLDAREAAPVTIVADDERAARDASEAVTALGLDMPADARVVGSHDDLDAPLVVWYGPPASSEHIAAAAAGTNAAAEVVLLATANELQRIRAHAGSIKLSPATVPQPVDAAAQRQRALRDELSTLLRRESVDSELALIEPLLATHDSAEIAAAALRLLGRARVRAEAAAAARSEHAREVTAAATSEGAKVERQQPIAGEQAWTRLFLSVGERDGAKRGDLVGAITGEADITGAQIGKIDLRDTYALVDIATPVADRVVERLTGVSIRGRRVTARQDRGGTRTGPPPTDARRPSPRRDFSDAPEGGGRGAGRGGPRATREHEEWSSRAERLRHAKRPPAGGSES
jgi:ATP-dependent RNA helicase DeaD